MARKRRASAIDGLWESLKGLPWWGCLLMGVIWWIVLRLLLGILWGLPGPLAFFAIIGVPLVKLAQFMVPGICGLAALKALAVRLNAPKLDSQSNALKIASQAQDGVPSWAWAAKSPGTADSVADGFDALLSRRNEAAAPPARLDDQASLESLLDQVEWRRFEALVERCFQEQGYSTASKTHGPDGGVDIRLYREENPDELAGVVQCKHWGRRLVGVEAIRALRGSMAEFKADRGHFVTSSTFSVDARAFAASNGITLVDRYKLIELILGFDQAARQRLLSIALEGRYSVPTCASCGTKMVKRTPRGGGQAFWGCVSYPRCRSVIRIGKES